MDTYIYVINKNLESSLCKEMIDKYENDENKYKGVTGYSNKANPEIKKTTDLLIDKKKWDYIDKILEKKLKEGIIKYIKHIYNITNCQPSL